MCPETSSHQYFPKEFAVSSSATIRTSGFLPSPLIHQEQKGVVLVVHCFGKILGKRPVIYKLTTPCLLVAGEKRGDHATKAKDEEKACCVCG